MQLYSLDRDGWVGIHDGLHDAEQLEWIDAADAEYLLIDSDGYLYEAHDTGGGFHGYEWKRTGDRRPDIVALIKTYGDNARLSAEDLVRCRNGVHTLDDESRST